MIITKNHLRRIIKEEKVKLNEADFGGYDNIVEEIFQELSVYLEEARFSSGDPDMNKQKAIEVGSEAIKADIIWPRLEGALPGIWDEAYYDMAEVLYKQVAEEWLLQQH